VKRGLFLLALIAKLCIASVTVDTGTEADAGSFSGVTSTSYNIACSACSPNLYLVAASGTILGHISAITFNSTSFFANQAAYLNNTNLNTNQSYAEIYGLPNPSSGTHALAITYNSSAYGDNGAVFLLGANQTFGSSVGHTGSGGSSSSQSGTLTFTVSSTASGNAVVDAVGTYGTANISYSPGGTLVFSKNQSPQGYGGSGQYIASSGGTVTDSWTDPSSREWLGIAAEIKVPGAASVTKMQSFVLGD